MSTEYIREVNIREGKVYLTSKSSNDDIPYHTWFCESLSRIYSEEGQQGLDRKILRMLCEYATLNGTHPSITRYRHALKAPQKRIICQEINKAIQAAYELLPPEDQAHPLTAQSEAAKAFRKEERKLLDQKYTALAKLCKRSTHTVSAGASSL